MFLHDVIVTAYMIGKQFEVAILIFIQINGSGQKLYWTNLDVIAGSGTIVC